jgi:RNA polymerase sigma-70 factor (ECF subfamily)
LGLIRLADKDLVQRVVRGDSAAFNLLVARWEKKLFNLAYRLTGDRDDAFDICQDSFVRAYEQISQLKDASKFANWLFKIARNNCISLHRSEEKLPKLEKTSEHGDEPNLEEILSSSSQVRIDGPQQFELSELRLIIARALDHLPFEQREAIVLKVYEGLKFSEIAEITECPVSTVKSRLYLGLIQLKKILANNQRGAP